MTEDGPIYGANDIAKAIAVKLSQKEQDETELTPAWRWKLKFDKCIGDRQKIVDREEWDRTKEALYKSLAAVPGEACYIPGETQWEAHRATESTKQVAGGWRAGKSKWLAAELLPYLFVDSSHTWIVANTYELARAEFGYILQWLQWLRAPIKKISRPQSGRWSIHLEWGAVLDTQTGDDVTKLEMVNLNAVGIAEAGQVYQMVYHRLTGRVMEKGGPIFLSGSFESSLAWYLKEFEAHLNGGDDWHSYSIPSWENMVVFPLGRQDPKILKQERELPEDLFRLKVGAEVIRPPELVYSQFDPKKHVTPMIWGDDHLSMREALQTTVAEMARLESPIPQYGMDGNVTRWLLPQPKFGDIEIAVDPGYNPGSYAVLAIQKIDPYVYVIDEIYESQKVTEEIISICKNRWWWRYVRRGTMDIAGSQHQGTKSVYEIWADPAQANINLEMQRMPITEGIIRTRTILLDPATKKPRIWFAPLCKNTIREFDLYRFPPTKETGSQREIPIDRDNHCVVGDTMIDTPGGRFKIVDLVGRTPFVYCNVNGKVAVRRATNIHKTHKNVEVVKVLMDKGELICTPDHLVMLRNGTYREAGSLKPGESLMTLNRYVNNDGYTRLCLTGQSTATEAEHRLVFRETHGDIPDGYHVDHIDGNAWNNDADNLQALSMEDHASKHHKGKVLSLEHRRRLGDISREQWVHDDGSRLATARRNVIFAHEANRGRVPHNKGVKQSVGDNHRVIAVVPAGRADVYDMSVEEAHNFVANGVVIHNSMKALGYYLVQRMGIVGDKPRKVTSVRYIKQGPQWHERYDRNAGDPYEFGI